MGPRRRVSSPSTVPCSVAIQYCYFRKTKARRKKEINPLQRGQREGHRFPRDVYIPIIRAGGDSGVLSGYYPYKQGYYPSHV